MKRKSIGQQVKLARKRIGMSQERLAELLKMTVSRLQRIESDRELLLHQEKILAQIYLRRKFNTDMRKKSNIINAKNYLKKTRDNK